MQLLPIMSGVQRSMLDIFKRLDRERYDISVICKQEGDLTEELRRLDIRVLLVNQLVREIKPFLDLSTFVSCIKIFRHYKFDLIHTHSSKTGLIGRLAGFIAGCPMIFHTVHGFPFHEFSGRLKTKIYSLLEWIGALVSTAVFFVNNEEREFAIKHHIVPKKKAVTVYNGVDLELVRKCASGNFRKQVRKSWNVDSECTVVGFVGRLWQQKDPETLHRTIMACQDLPVKFVIVGDGPFRYLFENQFPTVLIQGWIDNPFEYYPAIDMLIQPSLWEGLSMTLIEAMAFGKPLIASNIKGNRECVYDGKNGLLCTPKAPDEFKNAIKLLVTNRELYDSMSSNCLIMAEKYFNVKKNFDKIISIYEDALQRIRHDKD